MMVKALKSFKDAGDFNAAIQEWEARPAVLQTYENLKVVMCAKYSKLNCQDAVSARATGHASANTVEEFVQATEELIAELTEQHIKQIKALIKANSKVMANLTAAVPAAATLVAATRSPTAAAIHEGAVLGQKVLQCNNMFALQQDSSKLHP
jgi:hypothetical protein